MTALTMQTHAATRAYLPSRFGIQVRQQHESLWRVTRTSGEVLGYVQRSAADDGRDFRARRLMPRNQRFLDLGRFASIDDAIACFRFG